VGDAGQGGSKSGVGLGAATGHGGWGDCFWGSALAALVVVAEPAIVACAVGKGGHGIRGVGR
jgi:hypothetical protein